VKKILTLVAAALLALGYLVVPAPPASASSPSRLHASHVGWCVDLDVKVAPAQGQPKSWKVAVNYCQPWRWARGQHQLDVLTPGSTYTSDYWDWTQNPKLYSYVDKTLADGRATLNYDRIGNGDSTRPEKAADITLASDAYVLHQLIQYAGWLGLRHVNSISHSLGSGVALAEATSYNDVDSLVLTGYLHRPSNPAVTAGNYPANGDPKFPVTLDPQYLTSRPGVRGTSFHSPTSDPAVVALDDSMKDLVSLPDLLGFLAARGVAAGANTSNLVTVPVLIMTGEFDAIFCYQPAVFNCNDIPAVTANEAPFYTNAKSLTIATIAGSGHDLALHPSADVSYGVVNDWLHNL
jgi:pimeloyl-ACP methyl ester carboxylesterase